MGTQTKIEWTDHTFNPWIGCTKVSEGCKNCYAKTRDDRHMLGPVSHWGPGAPRHVTSAANWKEPLAWAKFWRREGKRAKVFCASQADIFEKEAPVEARRNLWKLIGDTCDTLDWQLLTKRPENITPVMCDDQLNLGFFELAHCWLGTSTENHDAADKRIPALLKVDAAVRFLSCEPLLGPLDVGPYLSDMDGAFDIQMFDGIDWVICGGESGPGARPMHPDWARSLRDQCQSAGVPFFFKQHGEWLSLVDYDPFVHGADTSRYAHQFAWRAGAQNADELPISSYRVGKKAAGALLDGREHKQFPETR